MNGSILIENPSKVFPTFPGCQPLLKNIDTLMCQEALETSTKTFTDITVIKTLNKAKFSVYLIASNVNRQNYAMKVFPFTSNNKPHSYFCNEARFAFISHPNVIATHHTQPERHTHSKGCIKSVSYTVMEYAPYGDFFDLVMNKGPQLDDMMIRTYFRQLIDGLEYLHSSGVSHMDIKLENLLIGNDFTLKIADFDLSYIAGDERTFSRGTKFYRPPEVIQRRCKNTMAADIYSAGIVLFTLLTRGIIPHTEDQLISGVDFAALLYCKNEDFWTNHCQIQKREASFFDKDFKELFNAMVRLNPNERATIEHIKQSAWYNGPHYTNEELKIKVGRLFAC